MPYLRKGRTGQVGAIVQSVMPATMDWKDDCIRASIYVKTVQRIFQFCRHISTSWDPSTHSGKDQSDSFGSY